MFSGGIDSWATARRVADRYGPDDVVLLFTDTNVESAGLYIFLAAAVKDIGGQFVRLQNGGRGPWQAMKEARFLGSNRVAVCSRILKQEPARAWLEENADPATTIVYIGMDASEGDRVKRVKAEYSKRGWTVECPLADWRPEILWKNELVALARERGLPVSPVYDDPATLHDNCDGACVRMGIMGWAHLLRTRREKYLWAERMEREVTAHIDPPQPIAILRDRRGGVSVPMPLSELRERVEALGPLFETSAADMDCGGCFTLPMAVE